MCFNPRLGLGEIITYSAFPDCLEALTLSGEPLYAAATLVKPVEVEGGILSLLYGSRRRKLPDGSG